MKVIADLHLHSKYSRACSKDLDLEHNALWAKLKGITVVGTADFTHPKWIKECEDKLEEDQPGLFKLKEGDNGVRFLLTTELSCIYKQGDATRRVHICVFAPSFAAVHAINATLTKRGVNLKSDGRPIMGLSVEELTKLILDADKDCMVVPAHAWTPWFAVFGSKSGFDSLEECFGSMTKYIYALETGLSSDPKMNWRLSQHDHLTLISNSDAHSPRNLGREANVFEIDESQLSYYEIYRIIKEKDRNKFLYTIEFFPEEGKYHWDGHRECKVQLRPDQTEQHNGICPVCKKPLTIGVESRVHVLADRPIGFERDDIPFKKIVPLQELIAHVYQRGKNTKTVTTVYDAIVDGQEFTEFAVLLDLPNDILAQKIENPLLILAIKRLRAGKVNISPGYDGEYGVISVLSDQDRQASQQSSLL